MKRKYVSYSDVLIRFIEPLIDGTEDADDFMMKARMGMVAWNYHVSDQNKLPYDQETKAIFKMMTSLNSEGQKTLNELVLRKEMHFSQYDQFIFKVERRIKPDNSAVLYVESCPADKLT
jgi:hypothetical protein